MIPALPTIQHSLHTIETGVTWLLIGFLLSASVGLPTVTGFTDSFLLAAVLVAACVLCGFLIPGHRPARRPLRQFTPADSY